MPLDRKEVDSSARLSQIRDNSQVQGKNGAYYTREPLLREIPDHGFVVALVSGTFYIYSRDGNNRYNVAMTLV